MENLSMVTLFLQALITFLVVVAPLKIAPIFLTLTDSESNQQRFTLAWRSCVIAMVILVIFGLFGNWLLEILSINIASFRIAGGFLLLILGTQMVFEEDQAVKFKVSEGSKVKRDIAVFPLAIPLIAGPATLTAVILYTDPEAYNLMQQGVALGALLATMLITYLCFIGSAFILRWISPGVMNIIGRITGIIVVAFAFEMLLKGIKVTFGW